MGILLLVLPIVEGARLGELHHHQQANARKAAWRESQLDDIREAVFRYQFDHRGVSGRVDIYYVAFERFEDPGDAFLQRFARHDPPVRGGASAAHSEAMAAIRTGGPEAREAALIFHVNRIEWICDDEVRVSGTIELPGTDLGSGGSYRVVRDREGSWRVESVEDEWIS